jgi:hypothetical protein
MSSPQTTSGPAPASPRRLAIDRGLQIGLALGGALVLCLYWRSWSDLAHLVYDIPAGVAMCAYIAQIVCEAKSRTFSTSLGLRALLMLPMSILPAGRDFFAWPISGHLSDILAVALIQSVDRRLAAWERVAYWLPLPAIAALRLALFDERGHAESVHAALAALAMFAAYLLGLGVVRAARQLRQRPETP